MRRAAAGPFPRAVGVSSATLSADNGPRTTDYRQRSHDAHGVHINHHRAGRDSLVLAVVGQTAQCSVELGTGIGLQQELNAEAALELGQGCGSWAEDLHARRFADGPS